MEDKIVEIIKRITRNKELTLESDIDLIENDLIDSLALIDLVAAIEETFDIEIQLSQVSGETWRTVKGIADMVKEKTCA